MKIATIIVRILLGLAFTIFGLNAFLRFIPAPPLPQNLAGDFMKVFFASGWVYFIGGAQLLCGLLLLIGRFLALALVMLGAIIYNIWAFHILMAPEGSGPAAVVTVLYVFLVFSYRGLLAPLWQP